ncbi:pyrimidine reductase family protein [Tenggerimyces flavus]|uniref:Pyrimidine reductase family protein n=1 Tax=Tenggerimyces flavus TaxID=1708749 RepID=A0ABV7YDC8_9ACTN|nr:pyrimidine reductase family protein [Tenggerimyces flavus]MBM7787809.1 riboflavin biosynthesis pyrimidine reductase [Tenggerimyces flavus]
MRLVIPPEPEVELDDDALARLYALPSGRRWVRAMMIATVDGAAHGPDGRSGSISGPADRRMMGLLRALSDVVLVGAETVRAEGYGPMRVRPEYAALRAAVGLAEPPRLAIVTRSLDLPDKPLADGRTIVLAPRSAPLDALSKLASRVDVVTTGAERVDLTEALDVLASRGLRHIQCEGGPRLLAGLVGAGLVDELSLTVSPKLLAGDAPRVMNGSQPGLTELVLASLTEEDGFLFYRWLRG